MLRALLLLAGFATYPLGAAATPPAPNTIVVISCRTVDLTGRPGRPDPAFAANGWRDLDWATDKSGNLECRRDEIQLTDEVALKAPEISELHPDMSDLSQGAAVALQYAPIFQAAHPGWGVMAIGLPVRITSGGPDGPTIGWKEPDCPSHVPGNEDMPLTCSFNDNAI